MWFGRRNPFKYSLLAATCEGIHLGLPIVTKEK